MFCPAAQACAWGTYADAIDTNPLPAVEPVPHDGAKIAASVSDTHALGIQVYQLLPAGPPDHNDEPNPVQLGNTYAAAIKSALDTQMAKGAARLKAVLEYALAAP